MKIENQVCTFEQAKKLKLLGANQETFFAWIDEGGLLSRHSPNLGLMSIATNFTAAFTVAELSEMLPQYYPSWKFPFGEGTKWIVTVICSPKPEGADDIHTANEFDRVGDTQAEALATLLIALLETEAVSISEVNERIATLQTQTP